MPRLPTSLLLKAYHQHRLLPLLLQECRCLQAAKNELQWLNQKSLEMVKQENAIADSDWEGKRPVPGWRSHLRSMCRERAKGKPLQYILGDQPFGDLEILCRKDVLIPRTSTESFTLYTAKLIRTDLLRIQGGLEQQVRSYSQDRPFRILDLCTGSGCIALLLHALLAPYFEELFVLGIDVSLAAIELARKNLRHNLKLGLLAGRASTEIHFQQANVLRHEQSGVPGLQVVLQNYLELRAATGASSHCLNQRALEWDVLISNPPYVSPDSLKDGTTERSVRMFEPGLALVPPVMPSTTGRPEAKERQEDIFYHHILPLWLHLRPKLTVFECGDKTQAERVMYLYRNASSKLPALFIETRVHEDESVTEESGSRPNLGPRAVIITLSG